MKAKSILTTVSVIAVIFVLWGLDAWSDYAWSKLIIEEKSKNGWVVGATQANFVVITRPWTIFKQPVSRIAFVKPSEFVYLDDGFVFVNILWVDHADLSETEEELFYDIYDCKNRRTAFVESGVSVDQIDSTKLEWRDNANTSAVDIAKMVCE